MLIILKNEWWLSGYNNNNRYAGRKSEREREKCRRISEKERLDIDALYQIFGKL